MLLAEREHLTNDHHALVILYELECRYQSSVQYQTSAWY